MGTYRQPSQIIDQRMNFFIKGFETKRKEIQERKKLEALQNNKIAKEQAVKAVKQHKIRGDYYEKALGYRKEINAFGENQGYLGYDIVKTEDGSTEVVKISDAQKSLLSKIYKDSKKGDHDNDPATPDEFIPTYTPTGEEEELLNTEMYHVRKILYDKDKNKLQNQDVELQDWYSEQIGLGHDPWGVGVKGSIEAQIKNNYAIMGQNADDPNSYAYKNSIANIETAIDQYPKLNGMMEASSFNASGGSGADKTDGIINKETGELTPLDKVGSVVMRKGEPFLLDLNAQIDWMTGQNKHRFATNLSDGDLTIQYANPNISNTVLNIDYKGMEKRLKSKGFGLIETTDQKPVDLMYKTLHESVRRFYKPITQTSTNKYTLNGKDITEKEAVKEWDQANENMEESIRKYFYSNDHEVSPGVFGSGDFMRNSNSQNNWQLTGGPTKGGFDVYWNDSDEATNKAQQKWMADQTIARMKEMYGADMDMGNTSIISKQAEVVKRQHGNNYKNLTSQSIVISDNFKDVGFQRDSQKYSFPEIKQNFGRLNKNPGQMVNLLNSLAEEYSDAASQRQYYTGSDVNKLHKTQNKQYEIDNPGEKGTLETNFTPNQIYGLKPTGKPFPIGTSGKVSWTKFGKELKHVLGIDAKSFKELMEKASSVTSTDILTFNESSDPNKLYETLTRT